MKHFKQAWHKGLIRPCIYQTVNRILFSLCVVLLLRFFLQEKVAFSVWQWGFALLCFLALCAALVVGLRLDGVMVPLLSRIKLKMHKKPAVRSYGDMIDHIDTEIEAVPFDDLSDEEQDVCRLTADVICCAVCLVLSFF